MIKNTTILAAITLVLGSVSANGAAVNGTNNDLGALTHKPISLANGTALTTGGTIQIGSFTTADPSALIAGLTSPAGLQALLADFITFGSSTSVAAQGVDFAGLYDLVAEGNIAAGNPLIGKSIYTLIGNSATLSGSTQLAIVRDNDSFLIDNPLFAASASLLESTNTYLFGSATGPTLTGNPALPANASLQLAPIPEPMSAALLLSGLALVVRRRRA